MGDINLFVPVFQIDRCLQEIRECLETGWTGAGFKTLQFENEWKKFNGYPAHGRDNGVQMAV
jgi:dTDP-4-amino-4,6-dideoxygalactose transaminase